MTKQIIPSYRSQSEDVTIWLNNAGKYKILSEEETLKISRKIKSLDKTSAKYVEYVNKLTVHNLRLVVKYVHGFMTNKTNKNFGDVDTVDYLQAGSMGLRRAAELFDPSAGYRFATYAYPWIRSFVNRYNFKIISMLSIPENALIDSWMFEKHGFLYNKSKTKIREKEWCVNLLKSVKMAQSHVSLDVSYCDNEDGQALWATVSYDYTPSVAEGKFDEETEDLIRSAGLDSIQIEVIRALYVGEQTITDIAASKGVSRSKISSIKASALKALKKHSGLL